MVTASRDKVRAVGAERTIPDPALVVVQCCSKRKRVRIAVHWQAVGRTCVVRCSWIDGPDARCVVRTTSREVAYVR